MVSSPSYPTLRTLQLRLFKVSFNGPKPQYDFSFLSSKSQLTRPLPPLGITSAFVTFSHDGHPTDLLTHQVPLPQAPCKALLSECHVPKPKLKTTLLPRMETCMTAMCLCCPSLLPLPFLTLNISQPSLICHSLPSSTGTLASRGVVLLHSGACLFTPVCGGGARQVSELNAELVYLVRLCLRHRPPPILQTNLKLSGRDC